MKKLLLTIGVFMFSISIFGQKLLDLNDLVGYWEPDKHATQLVMWFDKKDVFQIIEFSSISGQPLDLKYMMIVGDLLKTETYFAELDFTCKSNYEIIDENTLKCTVTYPENDVIIYNKVK